MNVQSLVPQEQKNKSKRRRILWLRIGVFSGGLLLIAAGVIFNIVNAVGGVIAFAALTLFASLIQYAFPLPSDPPQVSVTMQPSATSPVPADSRYEVGKGIWNIPYHRNPFFTGREAVLQQLHERLSQTAPVALTQPQVITGLGGIGKTQIAVEYAYRYRHEYQIILWAGTASRDTLISDFIIMADLLQLPEKTVQDQSIMIAAVKRWLANHAGWLLILDNADDLNVAYDFLPTGGKGHILLTTRAQALGTVAKGIEVENMSLEEGELFLLRRAKIITPDGLLEQASIDNRSVVKDIVKMMDGLPLALDQAGAYIEETACGFSDYLHLYQTHRADLLRTRGELSSSHPESVATTFSLAFKRVQQTDPMAADLLKFCAFLSPDAIPEELFAKIPSDGDASQLSILSNSYELDKSIRTILKYSLVRRDIKTHTLTIHRLVQNVLKDGMDEVVQHQWAKQVIKAISQSFPVVKVETWSLCQQYLSHVQACLEYIRQWDIFFPEIVCLLNRAGYYLVERAQYGEAGSLLQQALIISEQVLGPHHPDTALSLNNLGLLYEWQGKYEQAEPLLQRALTIREQVLGPHQPDTALSLNDLAWLYYKQAKYRQAEPLYQQALTIREQVLGPQHSDTATSLNNLAALYCVQGKYERAESLYKRALTIFQQVVGTHHPNTAMCLNNLGALYCRKVNYKQAESLFHQALEIREQVLGLHHPDTALSLNNLGMLYTNQGKYKQAEPLLQQALAIWEEVLGRENTDTLMAQGNYLTLLRKTKRYAEVRKLEERYQSTKTKTQNVAQRSS